MIQKKTDPTLSDLYELDETAWLEEMARLVDARQWETVDAVHLSEYLSDMAGSDRKAVLNRLKSLLAHLLKWEHQPGHHTTSWKLTIAQQRDELNDDLESATLRSHAEEVLPKAYQRGLRIAMSETGLDSSAFPAECPWTLDQILAES
jgi:hypothetical protein